ncbi:BREX system P-loop protein BrxC [Candidatus Halocynthiibacter alkanivorans]|uniref:BREX system P-loop protein BrxC n=1 Tax=Candidatus Halocynthiibacter alkanivorans TaxID=2267619 RepID=UPI000DF3FAAC|nr:BREX system P-loop protein BrxC [Candidatus Halocynthiibacter alkanivorans]
MADTQIKELFALDIDRPIEEVIKVDQDDAQIVHDEISEYIVTDSILEHYLKIVRKYWETKNKPHEGIGIWVSGFFGSGKSSFAKMLGLALQNRDVLGASAADLFGKRTGSNEIQVLLKQITEQIPTEAVIFDVSTDRGIRSGNQSITEIMYKLFLKNLGYAEDLDLAELEIGLEEAGELERFKKTYEAKHRQSWDAGKNKISFALVKASVVMHQLDPSTYTTPDSWVQAAKDKADITPGKLAERCRDLMQRRRESKSLVFVVDEIGQFVSRDVQKMLDLQGVVQNLGRISRGKSWLIVTSQEKLTELVSGLDDKRVELARLMDRFPIQVHLEASDISEVTSKRVLSKNAAAEKLLRDLFAAHSGRLMSNTKLSADIKLPELSTESFMDLYPLLPYQIDLIIEVVSGLRTQGGAGKHVGGANRTIIKIAQQLLIHDVVGLAKQPVGSLARIDQIYDLVASNIPSEIRSKITAIETEVEHPFAQPVAKAICLLQYVQNIHRTEENIAATLHGTVAGDSVLPDVKQALAQLVSSHKVRLHNGQYRIPTPAEDDWETTRTGIQASLGDINRLHTAIVTELWEPKPSYNLEDAKTFKAGLTFNGRTVVEQDIGFYLTFAEAGSDFTNRVAEARKRSQEDTKEVFWVASLDERIARATVEMHRSQEILSRKERGARTKYETALVSEEKQLLNRHQGDLKRMLRESMLAGAIYFCGNNRSPDGTVDSVTKAASRTLSQVLPDVYNRFSEGAARVSPKDLNSLITSESLRGVSPVFTQLSLIRDEQGQPVFNANAGALREVLDRIENKTSYGEIATGKFLIDVLAKEPFGWSLDVVVLFVVSLIRAGKIRATSKGIVIEDALSTDAKTAFTSNNIFKSCSFQKRVSGTDINDWLQAEEAYRDVFGKQLPEMQASVIAAAIRAAVGAAEEELHEVHATILTQSLPGKDLFQEAIDQMRTIRGGSEDDAITTFNAAHKRIKEAIKRGAELKTVLTEPALLGLKRARAVLDDAWLFLKQEPNLPDGLTNSATTLTDLLVKETFFRELATIDQEAASIRAEYEKRFNAAQTARASAYAEALTKLHAQDAWDELNEEQQERIGQPLKSRSGTTSSSGTTIPFMRSELSACPQYYKTAVKEMLELIEGQLLVTLNSSDFFTGRIETEEQLNTALAAIKQKVEKLLGQGKKILVQ